MVGEFCLERGWGEWRVERKEGKGQVPLEMGVGGGGSSAKQDILL